MRTFPPLDFHLSERSEAQGNQNRVAVVSAKNHKRQRRKRQSVFTKRKSRKHQWSQPQY